MLQSGWSSPASKRSYSQFLRGGSWQSTPGGCGLARIEFFGDTVESIRRFEVSRQRSLETLEEIDITALGQPDLWSRLDGGDHFSSFLARHSWFLLFEPHEMQEEARH